MCIVLSIVCTEYIDELILHVQLLQPRLSKNMEEKERLIEKVISENVGYLLHNVLQ